MSTDDITRRERFENESALMLGLAYAGIMALIASVKLAFFS